MDMDSEVERTRYLYLPPKKGGGTPTKISHYGAIVVVGANGSGKSRLGEWLDFEYPDKGVVERVYRISAQKSLRFPGSISTTSIEKAEEAILYGWELEPYQKDSEERRLRARTRRWRDDEPVPLNDYYNVVRLLYTDHVSLALNLLDEALDKKDLEHVEPEPSRLKRLQNLWEEILPHRKLKILGGKIEAYEKESDPYNASNLSDGERVIFYLIGQCLVAPKEAILVIDEPELHLHKAVQARLWDALEAARTDCTFVYLTHDTQFASTRRNATKVWLRRCDGKDWDYEVLSEDAGLPEDLLLSLLGSRTSILFTEAKSGSPDELLYRSIYPDMTVVPLGSCGDVIRSVKAFRRLNCLHDLACHGIIDRDHRVDSEVQKLEDDGIKVLAVSEIDSLFLTEGVLKVIEVNESIPPEESKVTAIKDSVFRMLDREKESLALRISQTWLRRALSGGLKSARSLADLESNLEAVKSSLNARQYYQVALDEIEDILRKRNYAAALRVYDNKGLVSLAAQAYGRSPDGLKKWILRSVQIDAGENLREALKSHLPHLYPEPPT